MNKAGYVLLGTVMLVGIGCKARPKVAAAPPPLRPRVIQPMAVVDVGLVAKGMGWDHEFQQAMKVADHQFEADLNRRLFALSRQVSDVRAQVAKDAHLNADQTLDIQNAHSMADLYALPISAAQRQLLMTTGIQINIAMMQARRDYRERLGKRGLELMDSYRKLIMPVAQQVAVKAGFRMIVTVSTAIAYYDPTIELSQQVIDELNRARPSWEQP